jgi:peptidoglycan-associated lipoprotein
MFRESRYLRLVILMALVAAFAFSCKKNIVDENIVDPQVAADSLALVEQQQAEEAAREIVRQEELLAAEEAALAAQEAERLAALKIQKLEEDIAALSTIYFAFDRSNLNEDARFSLNQNAAILERQGDLQIRIAGHCDENGSVSYNLALGDRRAIAVRDYLVNLGIDKSRFSTISFGKSQPALAGSNEQAWSKNRRCEFKVTNK